MSQDLEKHYSQKFFHSSQEGMSNSASTVLEHLAGFFQPQSLIDVGCGQGAWLAAAENLGVKTLKGLDGDWINESELLSQNIDFQTVNFEEPLPVMAVKYDLCISLEVAEHISENSAGKFVDFLCEASDVVLFGAAIFQQGGTNHINEQWQSYWISLFRANGYECFDVVRGPLWDDESVKWWYRQNTFVFVREGCTTIDRAALKALEKPIPDVVHPENYKLVKRIATDKKRFRNHAIRWGAIGFLIGVAVAKLS